MSALLPTAWGVLLTAGLCAAQTNSSNPAGYKEFKLDFAGGITLGILISIVCLIVGLFYLLVGARYPKASVASCSFLFATGGLYFLLNFFAIDAYICLIVGGVVGLIAIILTLKVWKAGLFILGGAAGFVIWLVVKALATDSFNSQVTIYVSMAAVVLVCALLAIRFEKQIFITATALLGSFFLVQGIDSLLPDHASVFSLIDDTSGLVCAYDHDWCTGIYIAIFVIALIGIVVQFKVTAKFYKKRRGVKNKSDFRRKRRGKRPYAKEEEPRDRRRYRNEDKEEDRKSERKARDRHSENELVPVGKSRLAEENAELRVRLSDMERQLRDAEAWTLTQEEKDLVTRFRVDKENARKKPKDEPPPYKPEPEKKSAKKKKKAEKKVAEKKRRDSTPSVSEDDSAEG